MQIYVLAPLSTWDMLCLPIQDYYANLLVTPAGHNVSTFITKLCHKYS